MKTKLSLLCCLFIVFATAANAQTRKISDPAEWKRYTVAGEEFSVMLPASPFMTTIGIASEHGLTRRVEHSILAVGGGVAYAISAYENSNPRQSLADFITEETATYRKDIISDREVEISGVVGHEYISRRANDQRMIDQFFATEQHLYKFGVYGAGAEDPGPKQFFSSIVLGKNPEGIMISERPEASDVVSRTRDEETFTSREVDQKAQITKRVPPGYSEEARRHKVSGTVILKVLLSATGEVTKIRVVSGLPYGLTDRAIAAARQIEFIPAMKDGNPVSMWVDVEFNFDIY